MTAITHVYALAQGTIGTVAGIDTRAGFLPAIRRLQEMHRRIWAIINSEGNLYGSYIPGEKKFGRNNFDVYLNKETAEFHQERTNLSTACIEEITNDVLIGLCCVKAKR